MLGLRRMDSVQMGFVGLWTGGRIGLGCRARARVVCCVGGTGGGEEAPYRRIRRCVAIVEGTRQMKEVKEAVKELKSLELDVFLEEELECSVERFGERMSRADAILYSPGGPRKVEVAEQVMPLVEDNYGMMSASLFLPMLGVEYLALNKLGGFDADRIFRNRQMSVEYGNDVEEGSEILLKRLPELFAFVSTAAVNGVQRFQDLAYSWQESSHSGYRVAMQIMESNLPDASTITSDEVEREVERMLESLGRAPTEGDFVLCRKAYLFEAVGHFFGTLDCVLQRISERHREEERVKHSKLRLLKTKELQDSLAAFGMEHLGDSSTMPQEHELVLEGRGDLANLIMSDGGFEQVAKSIGLVYTFKPVDTMYPSIDLLMQGVRDFVDQRARNLDEDQFELGRMFMPRYADFIMSGREDLIRGMRAYGGIRKVSKAMGLQMHNCATYRYKGDFEGLAVAIKAFIKARSLDEAYMPSCAQMKERGRIDLAAGIKLHGGLRSVASRMGLKLQVGVKAWNAKADNLEWLKAELNRISPNTMPTTQYLLELGRIDLVRAIKRQGGRTEVACNCDLGMDTDLTFLSEDLIEMEVCENDDAFAVSRNLLIPKESTPDEMATQRRRSRHHFQDFSKLRNELSAFIFDHGESGLMPTPKELLAHGRGDLLRGVKLHGGQKAVARKVGLVTQSQGRLSVKARKLEMIASEKREA